jgi:hypothetical protein
MNILLKTLRLIPPFLVFLLLSALCNAQDKQKVAYGLLLDNTGSMRTQFTLVTEIGKAITHQIHERGPVSIFDFTSQGRPRGASAVPIARIEQSEDEQLLEQTIGNLYVEGGQTTLLDAIQVIAERLVQQAGPSSASERVIVLITDGEDQNSLVGQKRLIEKLVEMKIRVFAIGLVQELDSEGGIIRPSPRSRAVTFLNEVTKQTGGRVVLPRSKSPDVQKLLAELALP